MIKRVRLCLEIMLIMFLLSGCRNDSVDNNIEKGANEIVEIIVQQDVKGLTDLLFGDDRTDSDDEIKRDEDIPSDSAGVLSEILAKERIRLKAIETENQKVVYEITAPDMSNVFDKIIDKSADMTETDLAEYLVDYIRSVDKTVMEVSLAFSYENNTFTCDYSDPQFVNAITGGLLDAYTTLYQNMIKEYLWEVDE